MTLSWGAPDQGALHPAAWSYPVHQRPWLWDVELLVGSRYHKGSETTQPPKSHFLNLVSKCSKIWQSKKFQTLSYTDTHGSLYRGR